MGQGTCGGSGQRYVAVTPDNPGGFEPCPSCKHGRVACTCASGRVACEGDESDFFELLYAAAEGTLGEVPDLAEDPRACVGVVVASAGYPGAYQGGKPIRGLDQAAQLVDQGQLPTDNPARARFFYDLVLSHMTYDKSRPGYGTGDAV